MTLSSIFYIAIELANQHRPDYSTGQFEAALRIVARITIENRPPTAVETRDLASHLDAADKLICQHSKETLVKAISYLEGRTNTLINR